MLVDIEFADELAFAIDNINAVFFCNITKKLAVLAGIVIVVARVKDLAFLAEVRQWVRRIAEGNYQASSFDDTGGKYQDKTLATLAAEFTQMATRVQQREETLRQQVVQLRIEIDQAKRKQEAEEIMGSEYYQSLKEKIKSLREQE